MKRIIPILLCTLLVLTACAASAVTYTAGDYYTIEYDDDLMIDDTSYTEANADDYVWLFIIGDDEYLIESFIMEISGYEDFILSEADTDEMEIYLEETATAFADLNPVDIGSVTADDGTLFFIYQLEDDAGSYYYAETIEDNWCTCFRAYYYDETIEPDDALLEYLVAVVETYTAVTDAE